MEKFFFEGKEYIRRKDKRTNKNELVNEVLQRKLTKLYNNSIGLSSSVENDTMISKSASKQTNKAPKSSSKKRTDALNYAFKCNYCDGGISENHIGFHGKCSDSMIRYNIETAKRAWCSNPDCPCRKYYDGKIDRNLLDNTFLRHAAVSEKEVCTESSLLKIWTVFPGGNNRPGPMQGTMRRLPNVSPGHLCVLTTREPGSKRELDRIIFAAFIIGECDEGDGDQIAGFAKADSDLRISFSMDEARRLRFHDYYAQNKYPDNPQWGSGLYRYITDEESILILESMLKVKASTSGKEIIQRMIDCLK